VQLLRNNAVLKKKPVIVLSGAVSDEARQSLAAAGLALGALEPGWDEIVLGRMDSDRVASIPQPTTRSGRTLSFSDRRLDLARLSLARPSIFLNPLPSVSEKRHWDGFLLLFSSVQEALFRRFFSGLSKVLHVVPGNEV